MMIKTEMERMQLDTIAIQFRRCRKPNQLKQQQHFFFLHLYLFGEEWWVSEQEKEDNSTSRLTPFQSRKKTEANRCLCYN